MIVRRRFEQQHFPVVEHAEPPLSGRADWRYCRASTIITQWILERSFAKRLPQGGTEMDEVVWRRTGGHAECHRRLLKKGKAAPCPTNQTDREAGRVFVNQRAAR